MTDVPKDIAEERICTEAAMTQWEKSLKRSDLSEKDRVRGAIEAYKRQSLAFALLAERERRTPAVVTWQDFDTAPKDGTVIMAWHTVHKCPMAIVWKERGFPYRGDVMNWYERSYTTAWPERCFSHWSPLPAAPSLSSGAGGGK